MSSLREKILNAKDISEELVQVQEWDVTVLVRSMTGKDRDKWIRGASESGKLDNTALTNTLLINNLLDPETRKPILEPADADALLDRNAAVLERLGKIILRVSGLAPEALDTAEKN